MNKKIIFISFIFLLFYIMNINNNNKIKNIYSEDYQCDSQEVDVIDATGKYVMPGFIDLHVHLRDPGLTYKEDIVTGANAAARGGVTTICAMPNTKPVVDTVETLNYVHDKASKEAKVRVKQLSAFTVNMDGKELVDMEGVEIEPTNVFRTMRHSLIIKLGVEFNVYKSSCLTANVVYNNNFTNVYKDNPLGHNISLNSLGLEIGFMF